jgi:putative tricarboxylic transport membrane protein
MVDRVLVVVLLLLAAVYLYATARLPALQLADPVGPKAFPTLLGIACALAALFLLVETFRARHVDRKDRNESPGENRKRLMAVAAVIGWTFLYYVSLEAAGYPVGTVIYLLGLLVYFHPRRWWINSLVAVLFSAGTYGLFTRVLLVDLSPGILAF